MRFYLTGGPVSIRTSRFVREAGFRRKDSEHLALIHRAEQLHAASPSGLDIAAQRLKPGPAILQLRQAAGGHLLILVWLRLSDGSKYRVAWHLLDAEARLLTSWERVPWEALVFSQTPRRASYKSA